MNSKDYFDFLARTAPLLAQGLHRAYTILSPGQRHKIRDAERLRSIGNSHYRDGRYDLAVYSLWESLHLNPRDTVTWLRLIRTYRASAQTPLALVAAGCALYVTDAPNGQSRIWSVIGNCNRDNYERTGNQQDIQAAITAFDRASKLDPSDVVVHWSLLESITSTMRSPEHLDTVDGMDLSSRAINAMSDLTALLRSGDGNAAENTDRYTDRIATGARQLADATYLTEYWRAQFATLAAHAASLSLTATQPAGEPVRRHGLMWKMAVSTAAVLLVAALAFVATGCSTNINGPMAVSTLRSSTPGMNAPDMSPQTDRDGTFTSEADVSTSINLPTPPPVNPQIPAGNRLDSPTRVRIEHDYDDDGIRQTANGAIGNPDNRDKNNVMTAASSDKPQLESKGVDSVKQAGTQPSVMPRDHGTMQGKPSRDALGSDTNASSSDKTSERLPGRSGIQ